VRILRTVVTALAGSMLSVLLVSTGVTGAANVANISRSVDTTRSMDITRSVDTGMNHGRTSTQLAATLKPPLTLLWHRHNHVLPNAGSEWASDPLVVGSRVFSFELEYQGDVLSARHLSTGELAWPHQIIFGPDACGDGSLAYEHKRLFVFCDDGTRAYAEKTGKLLWSTDITSGIGKVLLLGAIELSQRTGRQLRVFRHLSSDDTIMDTDSAVGPDHYLASAEELSQVPWGTLTPTWDLTATSLGALVLAQGNNPVANHRWVAVLGSPDNTSGVWMKLWVLSAADGAQRLSVISDQPPALNGNYLYAVNDNQLTAWNLGGTTPTQLWTRTLDYDIAMAPGVTSGGIYVATSDSTGGPATLYALDPTTGHTVWSSQLPISQCSYMGYSSFSRYYASMSIAQNRVVLPTTCGVTVYGPSASG
jgi:outer membrane protein assembly factor BamB